MSQGQKAHGFKDWMLPTTKWSDVLAVQWGQHASSGTLKRVYRSQIITPSTRDLIDGALAKVGKGEWAELGGWPGVSFELKGNPNRQRLAPETEAFLGLLASPHAAGPAYMIAQYRGTFGKRRIHKINVWRSAVGPNMALYIEDA